MPPQNQNKQTLKDTLADEAIKNITQKIKPDRNKQEPIIMGVKKAIVQNASTQQKTTPTPEQNPKETLVKPLQTYQSDVADAIRAKDESVASISLAEKKRGEDRGYVAPVDRSGSTKIVAGLLGLILLGTGIFIIYITLIKKNEDLKPIVIPKPTTLVSASKEGALNVLGLQTSSLFQEMVREGNALGVSEGSLGAIKLVRENDTRITPAEFLALTGWNIPNTLARALTDFMIGVYGKELGIEPFVILKVESFDLAFSGMLSWEKNIANDMAGLFTPTEGTFRDGFIKNRDVRAVRDSEGNITLLYSFLDPETIVITQSSEAFVAILNQFTTNQLVR